ncbi:MAG: GAF domain-containing protein [bacterium]|nr:GAF domain-containing protein [bacterium]
MKTKIVKGDLHNVGLDFAKKIIEISQILVSTLDIEEIIRTLINQSVEMILCEKFIVWIFDEKKQVLFPHTYLGVAEKHLKDVYYVPNEGVVGWVYSNKKALIEPNLLKSTIFVKKSEFTNDVRNVICVPIIVKGQVLGVLWAANKTEMFDFSSEDVNHLSLLANYSAIAIYNSKLYQKIDVEAKRIKSLYEISTGHTQEDDLVNLIDKVLLALTKVFDYKKFTVFLFDSNAFHLKFLSSLGYTKDFADEILFLEDEFIKDAIEENKVKICTMDNLKCLKKLQDSEDDIKSLIICPLYADKTLIGIFTMASDIPEISIDDDTEGFIKTIANQVSTVIQNNMFFNKAKYQIQEFKLLRRIFKTLQITMTLKEVLNKICDFVTDELGIDTCSILLYDDKTDLLVLKATKGFPQEWIDFETLRIGEGLIGWCAKYKEEVVVSDAQKDPRFIHKIGDFIDRNSSFLGHPILYKTKLIGVLVGQTLNPYEFSSNEIHTFGLIADEISLFIEKAKLFNELKDMYTKIIRIFSDIIEIQNPEISGHCDRVARYANLLSQSLELEDNFAEQIRIASYLHDLYKLGLDIDDLQKKGKIKIENEYIQKREIIFDKIIDPFNLPEVVKSAIYNLHENFDGTGKPQGLKGGDIPLEARILSVANWFDKISYPTEKKESASIQKGFEYLEKNKGKIFDPVIVDKFIENADKIHQVFEIEVSIRDKNEKK